MVRRLATLSALLLTVLLAASCSKDARQYFESGNQYFKAEKYREALVEYRNAVKQDPRFGEARFKLAETSEKLGDRRGAYDQFIRAADLMPGNVQAQLRAGVYLFLARKYQDAAARADIVLKKDPRNVDALILKGDTAAMLQDFDGAIRQIEEAIQIDPGASRAYTDLGVVHGQKGNVAAAEQSFRQAVQVDPKSIAARLALANFFLQTGRRAETEETLKAAHALDPKNVLPNRALATFYLASDRAAEAEPHLKAIAEVTKDMSARLMLADYYASTRRVPEAYAILEKLSESKEGYVPAKTRVAALQWTEGKRADAHKTVDAVLARDPKSESALLAKARFLLEERRVDDALAKAQAGAAANPRSPRAQYLLGAILLEKKDDDAAKTAFNEVLKINPRAVAAQLQLARIQLAEGRSGAETAVQHAEQALSTDPRNPVARLMLVRSLMAKGDVARADTELKRLLQDYPNVASVQASAGLVAFGKKDYAAARKAFERSLQIDANSNEALAGLVSLDLVQRKPAEALARVDARVAAAPNNAAALMLAARAYKATGDLAKAEQALLKTIQIAPGELLAYSELGAIYLRQRKLDEARVKFEELAKREVKPVGPETMVGLILQIQGRNADAQKHYERALQIDRQNAAVAANNLAWMYAEGAGNLDVALQLAQTAKAKLPESPEVDDTLGWIYVKKDQAGLAITPLQQAVERDPKNPTYQYHLGTAHAKAGDKVKARAALEAALQISTQFEGASEARRTLDSLK